MSDSAHRLPPPAGLLIDRDTPIEFRFEGRGYQGYAGDTIASALAANGVKVLSRSFKYHRPRGILTMAGQDANTLVQLEHEPNVLADRHPIAEGLEVRAQNVFGSLDRDWDALLGAASAASCRSASTIVPSTGRAASGSASGSRSSAPRRPGLGAVNLKTPHGYYDKAYGFYDLAVVGGGPAGLSAALVAARGPAPRYCWSRKTRCSAARSATPASMSRANGDARLRRGAGPRGRGRARHRGHDRRGLPTAGSPTTGCRSSAATGSPRCARASWCWPPVIWSSRRNSATTICRG